MPEPVVYFSVVPLGNKPSIYQILGEISLGFEVLDQRVPAPCRVSQPPDLSGLIGDPTFVISFHSDKVDVYHLNDFMKTKGWRFNVLQLPPALHFCITMPQTFAENVAERFLDDLNSGLDYAKSKTGTVAETTALYGLAGTLEGNQQVTEMVFGLFDYLYSL